MRGPMRATRPVHHVGRFRLVAAALTALLALSGGAVATSAANGKSYTAVMTSGSDLVRGGTYLTGTQYSSLAITITNTATPDSGSINLGSANIIPPSNVVILNQTSGQPAAVDDPTACFTVTGGATGATACYVTGTTTVDGVTTTGPVIAVRGLSLPSSTSATVTFPGRVECGAAKVTSSWPIQAKQSNDFNAQPGNDLTIDPPNTYPTSTVAGDCHVVFAAQPDDAERGQKITSVAYTPTGADVAVRVATGAGDADGVLFGNPRTVTLSKESGPSGAVLGGSITAQTNNAGVAVFAPTLDLSGAYTLRAADGANVSDAISQQFVIVDSATPCTTNHCTATQNGLKGFGTITTQQANGGFATVSFNPPGHDDLCGSGTSGSDVVDANITSLATGGLKFVTIRIDKPFVTKAANKYQICLRSLANFTARAGTPATTAVVVDGVTYYQGQLPDCTSSSGPAPCTLARTTVKGSVEVTYILRVADDPPGKAM